MEQAEAKNRETFEDNKLMVGQIKVLEQRKNELLEKLKLQQEKEAQQLQDRSGFRKDIDQLVARTQELERALALKDQALRTMDCERDELQNELDRETEERADLRRQLEVLERESRSAVATSSSSRIATRSPRASCQSRLKAPTMPRFTSERTTRRRGSATAASRAAVSGPEASSTTSTS